MATDLSARLRTILLPILTQVLEKRLRNTLEAQTEAQSEAALSGNAGSSRAKLRYQAAVTAGFEEYGKECLDHLVRIHEALGAPTDASLNVILKGVYDHFLVVAKNAFQQRCLRSMGTRPDILHAAMEADISYAAQLSTMRAHGEIDLYVESLRVGSAVQSTGGQVISVNIHGGTIGAVQTGEHARATVTQTFNPAVREAVQAAIEAVKVLIDSGSITGETTRKMREIIAETNLEIAQENPGTRRLLDLLRGLAATVSAIANADKAYAVLSTAIDMLSR